MNKIGKLDIETLAETLRRWLAMLQHYVYILMTFTPNTIAANTGVIGITTFTWHEVICGLVPCHLYSL